MNNKLTFLTGIRSNQEPTIGNFFGAIKPIIDIANNKGNQFNINLFIPDLHSFTTPIDNSKLFTQSVDTVKKFIAAGLPIDIPNINIYRQSFISAHSELTVILNNFTYMGELSRMTQFKEKGSGKDNVSVGLFDYPVLMAADILLYDASYIPVGDDQTQHLELTRDIATRMNNKFGELFVVPETVKRQHQFFNNDQGLRIMDLVNPSKKMSKSDISNKGVIFLNDSPAEASNKIKSATTDSLSIINYNPIDQPGVSNLLQIYALLENVSIQQAITKLQGTKNYGDFKQAVSSSLGNFLETFQKRLSQVDEAKVLNKLQESEEKMSQIANSKLLKVQKAVGLRR